MTWLVLFAHADPTATPPFYAPVSDAFDVEIRFFVSHFGAFSSAYDQLAAHLARPLLPAVAEYAKASKPLAEYDGVLLASWSAGYAMVRAILEDLHGVIDPDVPVPRGWVACDSGYGEPSGGVAQLAREAVESEALYFAGHTEIPTKGYLSSGQYLARITEEVGPDRGLLRIEDWGGTDAAAHVAALRVHGPKLLGDALRALGAPARVAVAPTDPPSPAPSSSGTKEAALAVASAELARWASTTVDVANARDDARLAFVRAGLGLNSKADVEAYFAGCQRDGKPLGLTDGSWCAAFVGWCDAQAGASWPWRAAVSELWADARTRDRAHRPGDGYVPTPGDLAIWGRDGEDPRTGGEGHVGRLVSLDAPTLAFVTIEGNHLGRVGRVRHDVGDAALVGWIER